MTCLNPVSPGMNSLALDMMEPTPIAAADMRETSSKGEWGRGLGRGG
jgi:hypothetical protein